MRNLQTAIVVERELKQIGNPKLANDQLWFYQTQKGGYGEGDKFLGIRVPTSRAIAKANVNLPFDEVAKLTSSKYHEVRFVGLAILVLQFQGTKDPKQQKKLFDFYLKLVKENKVNNWDLVDAKAEQNNTIDLDAYAKGVQDGAKWQQERMYSEEDLRYAFECATDLNPSFESFSAWFEQFKKK